MKTFTWITLIHDTDPVELGPTTRHVLFTIGHYMDATGGSCYPTIKTIARASGLCERAVKKHIKIAKDAGWVKSHQHGFAGQKWRNNAYEATAPDCTKPDQLDQPRCDELSAPDSPGTRKGGARCAREVVHGVPPTYPLELPKKDILSETSSDDVPKARKKRNEYPAKFDDTWNAYPTDQNMSKAEAFGLWKRLDDEDRDKVLASIPAFNAYCRAHPDYRPIHFCRYIKFRRFDGFAEKANVQLVTDMRPEKWRSRLMLARKDRQWSTAEWGPAPGIDGCLVPPELLQPTDGDGWIEWKAH